MSLKAFHFVFIIASIILGAGFGAWCVRFSADTGNVAYLVLGIASFLTTVGLIFYLGWFLRKTKKLGFLGWAVLLGIFAAPHSASACAVCLGDPSSPLTQSANTGVLFMLGVVASVLMGFGSLFLYWAKRARRMEKWNEDDRTRPFSLSQPAFPGH